MSRFLLVALVGIVLLGGTYVGVKLARDEDPFEVFRKNEIATATAPVDDGPAYVVCWGYVDGLHGWAKLYPEQVGRVVSVKSEYTYVEKASKTVPTRVKKGDLLLQVDDTLAQLKVKEAEVGVQAAQTRVSQATQLETQHPLKIAEQEAVISAAKAQRYATEQRQEAERQLLRDVTTVSKSKLAAMEAELKAVEARITVEERKLDELKAVDPKLEIRLANDDLAAKRNLVAQAKAAADKCKLLAPSDGVILRVNVRAGETLGPNPQAAAIEFLSDESKIIIRAEVLQEWSSRVEVGQSATILDDTFQSEEWKGHVLSLSPYLAPTRSPVIEPFRQNDVRTLEAIIEVDSPHDFRIGQRMRVKVKI